MLNVINPATEEIIAKIAVDTPESVVEKYQMARKAQPSWAATSIGSRLECLKGFASIIEQRKTELAKILTSEVGKSLKQSHNELGGLIRARS